jgi:putative transposase
MPRSPRVTEAGIVYHVLNRRVMRLPLFQKDRDYEAFERVLAASLDRKDSPKLLAFCLMPNHWHLVVQAGRRTNLSTWMQWVTVTHTHRWHSHYRKIGEGPLYQGRFKSFPVQEDAHFLTLCRYVEGNALRARMVRRAENWRWGSLSSRESGKSLLNELLREWPMDRPRNWLAEVNRDLAKEAIQAVRQSVMRGAPFGSEDWGKRIAKRLGLDITLRPRGRPRKEEGRKSS